MLKMDDLYWPLSVLSRAIDYKNLTGASKHIGLSQPQLSRVVKQLEEALNITLLDSSSPRHSTWTPEARSLAEVFDRSKQSLTQGISQLQTDTLPKEIHVGFLEGLLDEAMKLVDVVLNSHHIEKVFVDSCDLNILEARFISSDLDLVLTSRSPQNKKYSFQKLIGYQDFIELGGKKKGPKILSTFEYQTQKRLTKGAKSLITNSLYFKKHYQKDYGGYSLSPGEIVRKPESKNFAEVLVIAQDYFNQELWEKLF